MKKINSTHFLKQMKFRSDFQFVLMTILFILIISWIAILPLFWPIGEHSSRITDTIDHPDYLTDFNRMAKVYIFENGEMYVNNRAYESPISELSNTIIETIKAKELNRNKLLLIASDNLEYGKIVNILKQLKLSGIQSVFLTGIYKFSKFSMWEESGKIQNTWLYQPEMLVED